jgi:hypothetical protein
MAGLARKNLVVDADKLRELARRQGTSESQAVRQAVEYALAADEVMAAIRELHERGGLNDVFGRLPDELDGSGPES